MSARNEGSEDVDQFLARIASLSKKTDSDAEQARRAEEQMMQAKKERQARRAGMHTSNPGLASDTNASNRARSLNIACQKWPGRSAVLPFNPIG